MARRHSYRTHSVFFSLFPTLLLFFCGSSRFRYLVIDRAGRWSLTAFFRFPTVLWKSVDGVISGKESGFLEMFQAFSPEERAGSTSLSRPESSTTIHDFTEQELVQAGKLLRLLKLRMQRNDKYSSSAGAQGKHPFARIDGAVSRTKRGNDGGKKRAQHETENAVRHDRQFRTSGGRAEQGKLEKSPERRTQEEEKFPTDHWEGCDLRRLSRELKKAPCFARVSEKKERGEPGWRERLTSSSLEEEKFPFSFRKESTRSHRVHSNSRDTLRKSLSAAFDETCSPSALSEFSLPEKAGTYPTRRSNCEAEHLIPLSSSVCRRNASPSREENPEDDLCCAVGLACGTSSRESDSSTFSLSRASCQLGSCSDTGVRMPLEKTQTTARVNSSSLLAGRLCESSQLEFETVPRTARSEGAGDKQQRKHGPPPDRIAICRLASGQEKRGKVKRTERTTRSSTVSGTEQRSTDTEQESFASLPSRSSVSEWNKNKSEREPLSTKSTFDQLPSDESDSLPCASDAEGKDDAENERSEAEREVRNFAGEPIASGARIIAKKTRHAQSGRSIGRPISILLSKRDSGRRSVCRTNTRKPYTDVRAAAFFEETG
ncbi:putative transmembrane protein [Toxoplasma gondii MAS]|uniref:Putative transmembrane protein n=1 Tax=Toxoplasma gondii MAS TaxID=943118 RepID=A0A086PTU7_TOXGO|nr:putative transmembrane protein [Toxoplasma gondii MAS]